MSFLLNTDPSSIKKLEKQLHKESKAENSQVKHAMKDLHSLEKEEKKALKALDKAQHNLLKAERSEISTADVMNKARHNHDIAVANVSTAVKDLEIKKQHEAKVKEELEAQKVQVEGMVNAQHVHNQERESKISQIHAARAGDTPPHSAAPSTDNGSVISPVSPASATSPNTATSPTSA